MIKVKSKNSNLTVQVTRLNSNNHASSILTSSAHSSLNGLKSCQAKSTNLENNDELHYNSSPTKDSPFSYSDSKFKPIHIDHSDASPTTAIHQSPLINGPDMTRIEQLEFDLMVMTDKKNEFESIVIKNRPILIQIVSLKQENVALRKYDIDSQGKIIIY